MDKRRSCANCGSADHYVADCTTYKQGMKSLGYAPDEEDMSQMEEQEFYSGLIIKIGAKCFFCNQEGHFRMYCPFFWEAVKIKVIRNTSCRTQGTNKPSLRQETQRHRMRNYRRRR